MYINIKCKVGLALVGAFMPRAGEISNPNENIGRYGKETNTKNEVDYVEVLKSNEMQSLNDRVKTQGAEGTRRRARKGDSSIFSFAV